MIVIDDQIKWAMPFRQLNEKLGDLQNGVDNLLLRHINKSAVGNGVSGDLSLIHIYTA